MLRVNPNLKIFLDNTFDSSYSKFKVFNYLKSSEKKEKETLLEKNFIFTLNLQPSEDEIDSPASPGGPWSPNSPERKSEELCK